MRYQQRIQISLRGWVLLLQPLHFFIGLVDKIIGQQSFDVSQFIGVQVVGEQLQLMKLDRVKFRSGHFQEKCVFSNLQNSLNRAYRFVSLFDKGPQKKAASTEAAWCTRRDSNPKPPDP